MKTSSTKSRPLKTRTAAFCFVLDAFALQMDLRAARGSFPLLRTPVALGSRLMATIIRHWSTSWVGAVLGLGWVIDTFRKGSRPPR